MLLSSCEDYQALGVVDSDGMLGECDGAIGVAEGADPEKGVSKVRHDVARAGRIGQELR